MRLIDAEPMEAECKVCINNELNNMVAPLSWASAEERFLERIEEAETIDAVPVVRCSECKKYHAELGWCDEHSHFIDEERDFCYPHESTEWKMFEPDEWCSRGERKDGD